MPAAPRDIEELLPQLEPRAEEIAELATRRLRERGEREARDPDSGVLQPTGCPVIVVGIPTQPMPKRDPHIDAHLEWIGFVRPTGLVVSAPPAPRTLVMSRAAGAPSRVPHVTGATGC